MFELGARPHPPQALYRAYLEQSDVFVGIYWQRYGWVAPGMEVSGLEDEYVLAAGKPRLVYVKMADERDPGLQALLDRIASDDVSYRRFETAQELAELVADDLALLVSERFSPPSGRSAVHRAPIPTPASSFVGREDEVAVVVDFLRRDDIRLVTLVGPGGIGKTRLALQVAHRAAKEFVDGVGFVALAAVPDTDGVLPAIAEALGVTGETDLPLLERTQAWLAELELLLVLDNMEHVISASGLVAELLAHAPRLTALVTSRSRLDISGEHLFHVPPMSLPGADERVVEVIQRSDAVRLFAARAEASGWVTTDADAPIVADIVRRLDGLPLAIELAAAQARLVPAELIHTRLRRRLDLGGGPRDAEERHRTLRSTISWSYDLLDESARRFFDVLSVFVGGFSIEAAGALVQPGEDVEELLATLVDSSMVTTEPSAVTGVRFGMLETIREYAGERLEEREGRAEVAARHLAYFAQLADEIANASGKAGRIALLRLDEERENLRAALREAELTAPAEAVRLAGDLGHLWSFRGLAFEGREVIARSLAAAPDAPTAWRARALLAGAWLAAEQADAAEADRQGSEAYELFRSVGDRRHEAEALHALGWTAWRRGETEAAASYLEQSYRALSELPDESVAMLTALRLANVLVARGELDEARRLYERALVEQESAGLDDERCGTLIALGRIDERLGNLTGARSSYQASIAISRRIENDRQLAAALIALADLDSNDGRVEDAGRSYAEGLDLNYRLGDRLGVIRCLGGSADIALRRGDPETAARLLGAARETRAATGESPPPAEAVAVAKLERGVVTALGEGRFDKEASLGAALGAAELLALVGAVLTAPDRAS